MIAVKFERVAKKYRFNSHLAGQPGMARRPPWRELLLLRRHHEFWALRDINFEVLFGETIGIIGRNGAGKSTLLKLISKITCPSSGAVTVNGRLATILEVGCGFNPELTGRENIYLSAAILGMRRRDVAHRLTSIVDFSGVGKFIDTPVKFYSSGMYVRLGFSLAVHLNPQILLLDEVLAVGDAQFQSKCLQKIDQMKREGVTILIVSHDYRTIESMSDRALLLENGTIISMGAPRQVVTRYLRAVGDEFPAPLGADSPENGQKEVEITEIAFAAADAQEIVHTGGALAVRINYLCRHRLHDICFELFFYSKDGKFLHCQYSTEISDDIIVLSVGDGYVEFRCAELGLQQGIYALAATVRRRDDGRLIDWRFSRMMLYVGPGVMMRGSFYAPHSYRIVQSS